MTIKRLSDAESEHNISAGGEDPVQHAARVQSAAVFVALIAAGAFIAIPLPGTPVPIVLQNLFVVLAALFLLPFWAFLAVSTYLMMGTVGFPVFAGATGGLSHFAGPTGGFLLGYLPAATLASFIYSSGTAGDFPRAGRLLAALATGFLLPYLLGIPWLAYVTGLSIEQALYLGALPFLPGDLFKALTVAFLMRVIPRSVWQRFR